MRVRNTESLPIYANKFSSISKSYFLTETRTCVCESYYRTCVKKADRVLKGYEKLKLFSSLGAVRKENKSLAAIVFIIKQVRIRITETQC